MHNEAFEFVRHVATNEPISVIDVGSRDINGTCRPLFPNANYTGIDLLPGPAVDIVCDAATYHPADKADLVLIVEVLEHCANWRELIRVASSWLRPSGLVCITCAAPGRQPHSAVDGGELRDGEYYMNLTAEEIRHELIACGMGWIESDQVGDDTQAIGMIINASRT